MVMVFYTKFRYRKIYLKCPDNVCTFYNFDFYNFLEVF